MKKGASKTDNGTDKHGRKTAEIADARAKITALLKTEQNGGGFLSGSEIAGVLGMTRSNVWKHIRALEADGYPIEGRSGRGYRLAPDFDCLDSAAVAAELTGAAAGFDVQVFQSLPSTNQLLKEQAHHGARHGTVVIAGQQTAGRGRLGRQFFSPMHTGLYCSILLRPKLSTDRCMFLTTATAVVAAREMEQLCGHEIQIKWVNDLLLDGKKCAGILTEAAMNLETGTADWAVIGIGINCFYPSGGFPAGIADRAGVLFDVPKPVRCTLAARLISAVTEAVMQIGSDPTGTAAFIDEYRRRSYLTGKPITILSEPPEEAFCIGITDRAALIAQLPDGQEKIISTGDVSVRMSGTGNSKETKM